MSTDATPTDRATPRPTSDTDPWRVVDEPMPTTDAPLVFSPYCRRRLPNTMDRANAYAGPDSAE